MLIVNTLIGDSRLQQPLRSAYNQLQVQPAIDQGQPAADQGQPIPGQGQPAVDVAQPDVDQGRFVPQQNVAAGKNVESVSFVIFNRITFVENEFIRVYHTHTHTCTLHTHKHIQKHILYMYICVRACVLVCI